MNAVPCAWPAGLRQSTISKTHPPETFWPRGDAPGWTATDRNARRILCSRLGPTGPRRAGRPEPIPTAAARQRRTKRCHHEDGDVSSLGAVAEH